MTLCYTYIAFTIGPSFEIYFEASLNFLSHTQIETSHVSIMMTSKSFIFVSRDFYCSLNEMTRKREEMWSNLYLLNQKTKVRPYS